MSASKPLLALLFPVALGLPAATAVAQNAAPTTNAPATLTPAARPATAITPQRNLAKFASAKTTVAPIAASPVAAAVPVGAMAPVAPAKVAPVLPAPSWSQNENPSLSAPQPIASSLRIHARARRAQVSAFTLPVSPGKTPIVATPASLTVLPTTPAPLAVSPLTGASLTGAPLTVTPLTISPKIAQTPVTRTGTSPLASREAQARELMLARMDAQLDKAEDRLDRAHTRLTEGQKQLGSVNNLLQSAMLSGGDNASGLHPFVRVAQRYLGTPYVWGGESARGFDCSGFIMRVMRDLGYEALPHSAAEQFNYGKPIAKYLLQPGDIVFFANTYKPGISHVGIYLGGGRFIHAANSQVGTIVSSLNQQKWIDHYAGARRLVKLK